MKFGLIICLPSLIKVEHSLERSLGTKGSMNTTIKPIACRTYRPRTKEKVKSLARTVEQLKVYNGEINTLNELINLVFEFNKEMNKETTQAIDGPPVLKFTAHEKEHLLFFDSKLLTT